MRPELFWIIATAFAIIALIFLGQRVIPQRPATPVASGDVKAVVEARTLELIEAARNQGQDTGLLQRFQQAFNAARWEEAIKALNNFSFILSALVRGGRLSPADEALLRISLQRLLEALVHFAKANARPEAKICVGLYRTEAGEDRLIGPFFGESPADFRLQLGGGQAWSWQLQEQKCLSDR